MFAELKTLFSKSFLITKLKDEAEFDDFFQLYATSQMHEKLDQYLHDAFLTSVKGNYQVMLTTTAEFGLKAYTNWKLSFPQHPQIPDFSEGLNLCLRNYENDITMSLLKILIFLKENFSPNETIARPFLLPFLNEGALNKRFPTLSSDFKVLWYERYITNLEKTLILKFMLYSSRSANQTEFKNGIYKALDGHSNLARQIGFLNNKVRETLNDLHDTSSLLYQSRLATLPKLFSVIDVYTDSVKAINIEQEYSQEFSTNPVRFKEEESLKIVEILNPYFSEDEQPLLRDLIFGSSNEQGRGLIFQQTASSLIYFFKILFDQDILIAVSKNSLGVWITSNFKFMYKGTPIDIKHETVKKYLKPDAKPPKLILSID